VVADAITMPTFWPPWHSSTPMHGLRLLCIRRGKRSDESHGRGSEEDERRMELNSGLQVDLRADKGKRCVENKAFPLIPIKLPSLFGQCL
jgi:hypothetical protein